jgi:hypothetical protein
MKLKSTCVNGKFKTTPHVNIMEQLQIRADRFRRQGRLRDEDLEEIINAIKADDNFKDNKENGKAALAATNKQSRVLGQ